ncbi:unnamed protein product [Orchesella dallaii]|uniref:Uncharacterized protein n=1 Tax=Orchesella dallaii TaxID=48710 RepID=A0ABP1QQW0_9HEXA
MLRKPNMQQAFQRRYEPIRNQYQILKREDEKGNFDSKLNTVTVEIREFTKKWIDPLLESHREVGEMGKEKASQNLQNAMEAAAKLGTAVRKIKSEWEAVKDDWGKTLCDTIVNGTKLYFQFSNTTD